MKVLEELSIKERIILIVGAIIIVAFLYSSLFLYPSLKKIKTAEKKMKLLSAQWTELQNEVRKYHDLPVISPPVERVSLLAFLEESGSSLKISNKIVYLKPFSTSGKGEGAEVKLDDITGEEMIRFLHKIQEAQIKIVRINIRDHNLDGLWTVKMFLEE